MNMNVKNRLAQCPSVPFFILSRAKLLHILGIKEFKTPISERKNRTFRFESPAPCKIFSENISSFSDAL